jgi:hypothetical protein
LERIKGEGSIDMIDVIDFNYEHESRDDITEYECSCQVSYYIDNDYGADADGNRGEPRIFIEDIEILSVYSGTENVEDYLLPDEIPAEMKEGIIERAREFFFNR